MKLKNIAKIQTGIYKKPDFYGDIIYLQAKHFYENGRIGWKDFLHKKIIFISPILISA